MAISVDYVVREGEPTFDAADFFRCGTDLFDSCMNECLSSAQNRH